MELNTKNPLCTPYSEPGPHWSTSILTKMTGVVLWTLMLLMFVLALFIIHQQTLKLKTECLSQGERSVHHIFERYGAFLKFEEHMNQLLENTPPSSAEGPGSSTNQRKILSLIEQSRTNLEQNILSDETEEGITAVGLLTAQGTFLSDRGTPDISALLQKKCKEAMKTGAISSAVSFQEYDRILTLLRPVPTRQGTPAAVIAVAISKDLLNDKINVMRKNVFLMITLVVIFLSFPIIHFLQKWVVQPIRDITDASKEISDGLFEKRIPVHSKDEIGLLAMNFNRMASSLNYRDKRLLKSFEQIRNLKDYYNSIISNAPAGIMTVDQDETVAFANFALCEMLQDETAHSKNGTWKLGEIKALRKTRIHEMIQEILSGRVVEEERLIVSLPAGENKIFSIKGVPLLNEHQGIQGSLLIFADITKRVELEDRLKETNQILERTVQDRTQEILRTNENLRKTIEDLHRANRDLLHTSDALKISNEENIKANRMKTEFLASISHELRTPLNAVIGFSDVILMGIDGPVNDQQKEDLKSIARSGRHLLHLINDLLDLSRIETGKVSLNRKNIDAHLLLEELHPVAKSLIADKPIIFRTDVEEGISSFHSDKDKILQILLNLISNAVKFTHRGEISISVSRGFPENHASEAFLQFTVSDTGVGIREEEIRNIFNEFTQIDRSSRNLEGSGLGLSITRKLVELCGGKIWVDPQYREGSRFHFTLPLSSIYAGTTETV